MAGSRPGVGGLGGGAQEQGFQRNRRNLLGVIAMLTILIEVMLSWCIYVKASQTVHFKYVRFTVYQLDFNKVVKNSSGVINKVVRERKKMEG